MMDYLSAPLAILMDNLEYFLLAFILIQLFVLWNGQTLLPAGKQDAKEYEDWSLLLPTAPGFKEEQERIENTD